MPLPEDSRSDNRVSLGEREQVFLAGNKVIRLCRAQGLQNRLIGWVAQGFILFGAEFYDLRQRNQQSACAKAG